MITLSTSVMGLPRAADGFDCARDLGLAHQPLRLVGVHSDDLAPWLAQDGADARILGILRGGALDLEAFLTEGSGGGAIGDGDAVEHPGRIAPSDTSQKCII